MTTATLNYSKTQEKLSEFPEVNRKIICAIGFVMCLCSLVFYVLQINDLTRGSYLVNSYENQISQLSDANKNLEVTFAENSFLGQAIQKTQAMNFQKVTAASVKYVQITDNPVAAAITR